MGTFESYHRYESQAHGNARALLKLALPLTGPTLRQAVLNQGAGSSALAVRKPDGEQDLKKRFSCKPECQTARFSSC